MAVKVEATDILAQAMRGCIELEKSKRGLGKLFHSALVELLNTNTGMTGDELAKEWLATLHEVENTLRSEIVEALGEYDDIKEVVPSWVQYRSDVKRALELVDRRDLMRCGNYTEVKAKLQEVRDAVKEKKALENGDPADSKAGDDKKPGLDQLPGEVQATLREALKVLSGLPEDAAAEVAENFKNAAAAKMRRLSLANKKIGATAGVSGGAKVAANQ